MWWLCSPIIAPLYEMGMEPLPLVVNDLVHTAGVAIMESPGSKEYTMRDREQNFGCSALSLQVKVTIRRNELSLVADAETLESVLLIAGRGNQEHSAKWTHDRWHQTVQFLQMLLCHPV